MVENYQVNVQHETVSIVIPIFNAETYLNDCLASIQRQTYSNFEVLMIDDGSKDKSIEISKHYALQDHRFVQLNTDSPQSGPARARNIGLNMATGSYVMFVDADDLLCQNALSTLLKAMDHADAIFCEANIASDFEITNVLGDRTEQIRFCELDFDSSLQILFGPSDHAAPWGKLYSRAFVGKQRFPEELRAGEDYVFNLAVFTAHRTINARYCSAHLYNYRIDGVNHIKNAQVTKPVVSAFQDYINVVKQTSPDSVKYLIYRMAIFILSIENIKATSKIIRKSETAANQKIIARYRDQIFQVENSNRRKLQMLLFQYVPGLYSWLYRLLEKSTRGGA
ncbi:glycosyltransferase family 2 protein [Lacticaseibacillus suilingensis]|uniref:Glycosyltransferase family 2 protein n=1 Tax=Lacticaseibacillus suilingensis TaxID=2799577 RepID=A0ABW4BIA8_9LACO|nr:glycosyltransferase family A protein [Lacticaseibacillus suilingensis]